MKRHAFFTATTAEDMFTDDEAPEEPTAKTSSSGTEKLTKGENGDLEPHYIEQLRDRVYLLEQEVVKLQFENKQLSVTKPGLGKVFIFSSLTSCLLICYHQNRCFSSSTCLLYYTC